MCFVPMDTETQTQGGLLHWCDELNRVQGGGTRGRGGLRQKATLHAVHGHVQGRQTWNRKRQVSQIQMCDENNQDMRFLQLNLSHCEAAQDLLRQTEIERQIDIAIVSPQYRNLNGPTRISDSTGNTEIWAWTCDRCSIQEVECVSAE